MERNSTHRESSFPHVSIRSADGRRAVEVTLLSQLDIGSGDAIAIRSTTLQASHPQFNDALDEPSVRLSAPDLAAGDPAALYTFAVGRQGHPFHRHAAPRLFTAISGSGGCRLRFIADSSSHSSNVALHHVEIPADCLFTVRMAANTWHQFQPLQDDARHPALFAISCHPDETAGALDDALHAEVMRGEANLASLTELMPDALQQATQADAAAQTTVLRFNTRHWQTPMAALCTHTRRLMGRVRQQLAPYCTQLGSSARRLPALPVLSQASLSQTSLLSEQLPHYHHQDCVSLQLDRRWLGNAGTEQLLAELLAAFIQQPAGSVSGLMRLRNVIARPLGLRTSSLGCPVSSLLSDAPAQRFAQRFPVLASAVTANQAQVILGADDRHLQFRSCVGVQREGDTITFQLATRVYCRNLFGHLYMGLVDPVHRHFIAPKMLRTAVTCMLEDALSNDTAAMGTVAAH